MVQVSNHLLDTESRKAHILVSTPAHVGTLNIPCLSISTHLSNSFSCSMKLFHLKIALVGLALGESWPLLPQPQKNTGVQCLPLPVSVGELF